MVNGLKTLVTLLMAAGAGGYPADVVSIWEGSRGSPEVVTVMDLPSGLLPGGASGMDLMVLDDPEDGAELAVIGYDPGAGFLGTVTFGMFLNPAKTIAYYDHSDSLVIVSSEYPSRATRNNVSYRWDAMTGTLVIEEEWVSDRSAELLASADSLLALGLISQAADSISAMFYGWAYYDTAELGCRFLRASHRAAITAGDREGREAALDRYDQLLYALESTPMDDDWFIFIDSRDDYLASGYALHMSPEELSEILEDLSDILDDNGVAAASVLGRISGMLKEE